jgi:GNAT superfamily N-acetyltransferase
LGVDLNPPEPLTAELDTSDFCSGKSALDDWLKKYALQAASSGTARTFVVVNRKQQIVAYYSLSMGQIAQQEGTDRIRKGTGRHPIPVIVLARLAVDKDLQGRGLGKAMLRDAVMRCANISGEVAFRAIITHPLDDEARKFYEKFGFEPSPIAPNQLMILMKDICKALDI